MTSEEELFTRDSAQERKDDIMRSRTMKSERQEDEWRLKGQLKDKDLLENKKK